MEYSIGMVASGFMESWGRIFWVFLDRSWVELLLILECAGRALGWLPMGRLYRLWNSGLLMGPRLLGRCRDFPFWFKLVFIIKIIFNRVIWGFEEGFVGWIKICQ